MVNKFVKYATVAGLIISFISFILVKSNLVTDSFESVYDKIYKISVVVSILFVLTISKFINEKFNLVYKTLGAIFLVIVGMNFLNELNIYKIENIQMFILILFSIPVIMYLNFFRNKLNKNYLDYLKISFISIVFIGGFLKIKGVDYFLFDSINQVLFWSIIIGCLANEYQKKKINFLD